MSFSNGDKVQVGNGNTTWTVKSVGPNDAYVVQSDGGTIRTHNGSKLTLVRAATPVVKFSAKPARLVKGKRGGKLRTVR